MSNMETSRKPMPVVIDAEHIFQPVVCGNLKDNGYKCFDWIGEVETSRPNISKHRCKTCKMTYKTEVFPDGMVKRTISKDKNLPTDIPVRVG